MLNKKSAVPPSDTSNHLKMEIFENGKHILQFAEDCPICTEKYYEKAVINSCQHEFCFSCVLLWAEVIKLLLSERIEWLKNIRDILLR